MHIRQFRIRNYKSFDDSGAVSLSQGFNIFVGKNNAGKTALLEALSLFPVGNKPHLSSRRVKALPVNPQSTVEFKFLLEPDDLYRALIAAENIEFPVMDVDARTPTAEKNFRDYISNSQEYELRFSQTNPRWTPVNNPSHKLFLANANRSAVRIARTPDLQFQSPRAVAGAGDSLPALFGDYALASIYSFRAERLAVGEHGFGQNSKLNANASNLAEVLNILQHQYKRFERFNNLLRSIFPAVRRVSVRPKVGAANMLQIMVWNSDAPPERDDLAQPLAESGTGIGQVSAMLYVLITAETPQVIIIDEPNTFLHPGATRKLFEVMKSAPIQHQYIIATHSPEIIGMTEAQTAHLVKWRDEHSMIESLDTSQVRGAREALIEVGARLSDVFGADQVLWVEGPTEQECFPKILAKLGKTLPAGTSIVALRNTGDLESRKASARATWEIYKRLTTAKALIPAAVGFSLDREGRTEAEMDGLVRESQNLLRFIPRRTFENYLLDIEAIAAVLNSLPAFQQKPIAPEAVNEWIVRNPVKPEFVSKFDQLSANPLEDERWIAQVNAPKFLDALFSDLSETKEEFRKNPYSMTLTEKILERNPTHFAD